MAVGIEITVAFQRSCRGCRKIVHFYFHQWCSGSLRKPRRACFIKSILLNLLHWQAGSSPLVPPICGIQLKVLIIGKFVALKTNIKIKIDNRKKKITAFLGTSLAVQWLIPGASMQGPQVPFLVGGLRSHMLSTEAKKKIFFLILEVLKYK